MKFFDLKQAKKEYKKAEKDAADNELLEILNKIKISVNNKSKKMFYYDYLTAKMQQKLIKLGFKIEYVCGREKEIADVKYTWKEHYIISGWDE